MTRFAVAVDRLVVAVVGAALVALGLALVAWQRTASTDPTVLDTTPLDAPMDSTWWPWAVGGAGVVLVALALRWLATHRPAPRAGRVGVGRDLTGDAAAVAGAAGNALAGHGAVVKAGGGAHLERGTPTVTLSATVPARHGLAAGAAAADDVAGTVAAMLGDTVAVRTVLTVDGRRRHGTVR